MPFTPPDPTSPPDSQAISQAAAAIRAINSYLLNFLGVSFDLTTGAILTAAVPNGLPTPYGSAGKVLTSSGPSTAPTWETPGSLSAGFIMAYGSTTLPSGWLVCDGSTKLIASYPGLAGVLGTTFGGDGITTFGLPDLRGRAAVGLGTGDASDATAWTLPPKAGTEGHTLTTGEIPSHAHTIGGPGAGASSPWAPYSGQHQNGLQGAGVYPIVTGVGSTDTQTAGGGTTHINLQPSLGLQYLIKT